MQYITGESIAVLSSPLFVDMLRWKGSVHGGPRG